MHKFLFILISVSLALTSVPALGKRTLRRNLESPMVEYKAGATASVVADSGMVSYSRYDKPLRSRYETVFVSNHTDSFITSLKLHIRYSDMRDNVVHEVTRNITCELLPRSTRHVSFLSWDKQLTHYYYNTEKPSRAKGTPYKVALRTEEITVMCIDSISK